MQNYVLLENFNTEEEKMSLICIEQESIFREIMLFLKSDRDTHIRHPFLVIK